MAFWKNHTAGTSPLQLPFDSPSSTPINKEDSFYFELPQIVCDHLHSLASDMNSTLHHVLLGALYILLHRYTRQDSIGIVVPVSNLNSRYSKLIHYCYNYSTNYKLGTFLCFLNCSATVYHCASG